MDGDPFEDRICGERQTWREERKAAGKKYFKFLYIYTTIDIEKNILCT
jgi:hypothetical protein